MHGLVPATPAKITAAGSSNSGSLPAMAMAAGAAAAAGGGATVLLNSKSFKRRITALAAEEELEAEEQQQQQLEDAQDWATAGDSSRAGAGGAEWFEELRMDGQVAGQHLVGSGIGDVC